MAETLGPFPVPPRKAARTNRGTTRCRAEASTQTAATKTPTSTSVTFDHKKKQDSFAQMTAMYKLFLTALQPQEQTSALQSLNRNAYARLVLNKSKSEPARLLQLYLIYINK